MGGLLKGGEGLKGRGRIYEGRVVGAGKNEEEGHWG